MARPLPEALDRVIREVSDASRRDAEVGAVLLERFNVDRNSEAFRALTRMYAPMVWGVCRRVTHKAQDAEDAFQATFIVLARKADRIVPQEKPKRCGRGISVRHPLAAGGRGRPS
jgi:hypothetical protein